MSDVLVCRFLSSVVVCIYLDPPKNGFSLTHRFRSTKAYHGGNLVPSLISSALNSFRRYLNTQNSTTSGIKCREPDNTNLGFALSAEVLHTVHGVQPLFLLASQASGNQKFQLAVSCIFLALRLKQNG